MDWMLPGVAPTGRRVEVPWVAIVRFRDGKLALDKNLPSNARMARADAAR